MFVYKNGEAHGLLKYDLKIMTHWRRERDSNSRQGYPCATFPGW